MLVSLLLLLAANGSPVLAHYFLHGRVAYSLDGGLRLPDGHRLLGDSKTIRGVLVSVAATALLAPLLGHTILVGALFGAASMLGDTLSSFIKRRMRIPASGMAIGIDQLPEAYVPLILLREPLALNWQEVALTGLIFMALELVISRVLYALRIRHTPY